VRIFHNATNLYEAPCGRRIIFCGCRGTNESQEFPKCRVTAQLKGTDFADVDMVFAVRLYAQREIFNVNVAQDAVTASAVNRQQLSCLPDSG
jgi:hypothetical protein